MPSRNFWLDSNSLITISSTAQRKLTLSITQNDVGSLVIAVDGLSISYSRANSPNPSPTLNYLVSSSSTLIWTEPLWMIQKQDPTVPWRKTYALGGISARNILSLTLSSSFSERLQKMKWFLRQLRMKVLSVSFLGNQSGSMPYYLTRARIQLRRSCYYCFSFLFGYSIIMTIMLYYSHIRSKVEAVLAITQESNGLAAITTHILSSIMFSSQIFFIQLPFLLLFSCLLLLLPYFLLLFSCFLPHFLALLSQCLLSGHIFRSFLLFLLILDLLDMPLALQMHAPIELPIYLHLASITVEVLPLFQGNGLAISKVFHLLESVAETMLSNGIYYLDSFLLDLQLKPLHNLQGLLVFRLHQIEDEEVLSGSLIVEEHAVSDPGDLALAVVLGIHYQLLTALRQCLRGVFQLIEMLSDLSMDRFVFHLMVGLDRQEGDQLLPGFQVKRQKLFNANTGSSTRVFLVIGGLFCMLSSPMEVEVVIDSQYLRDACLIKHLMDTFGDHAQQFLLVAVPEPEDEGVVAPEKMGVLLVVVADLAVIPNDTLQEERDLLLVVAMNLLSNQTVELLQQLVLLLPAQPPHLFNPCLLFTCCLLPLSFPLPITVLLIIVLRPFGPNFSQIIQQSLSVVVGAAHNDGNVSSALDLVHSPKCLGEVSVPVVGILMELKNVNHVVRDSFGFLGSDLGSHD